jgi:hypothetical protein
MRNGKTGKHRQAEAQNRHVHFLCHHERQWYQEKKADFEEQRQADQKGRKKKRPRDVFPPAD